MVIEQESSIELQKKVKVHSSSENPNPVLKVDMNGKVLYSNRAACFILEHWGIAEGEKLPTSLKNHIKRILSQKDPEHIEISAGKATYSLTFYASPEENCVDIYGFDISYRIRAEEKLRSRYKKLERLVELKTIKYMEVNEKLTKEVAERKKVEKVLRNNLKFLEILLDSIPSPIFQRDLNEIYVNCNESFARQIMGLPKEMVIGVSFCEFQKRVPNELAEIYYIYDKELIEKGGSHYYETRVMCADGVIRDFLFHKATYDDIFGNVAGIVGVMLDITPIKEAENFYRKTEEKYRLATEQTGQLVYDYDVKNKQISWAGAIEELTGYSFEEFQAFTPEVWAQHVHPDDREKIAKAHAGCVKDGKKFSKEYRFRKKDKSYIFIEDSGVFLKNKNGSVYRVLGVIKDITEKRTAQGKLKESEERFRIAAEQTGQIVFEHDHGDKNIKWAGAIQDVTGYTVEEFREFDYTSWVDHIHPEDRERALNELRTYREKENKFRIEYRFRTKDANYIYIEDSGVYLRNEDGNIRKSLGVMKDITGIKLASEKLKESEVRYGSFMKNFRGIAFQIGFDFFPVLIDGNVEEITGYTKEDLISGRMDWYQLVYPEDRNKLFENMEKLVNDPLLIIEHDYRIVQKDGNVRWVREIVQNVSDYMGKKRILQGAVYDISKQKEAEESLAKVEEFRKKEIHHRIKNNLQVISSLLELQAEKFSDINVLEAFRESQNRVATMAIIHEELYRSRNNETLDFSAYLLRLTSELFHSYVIRKEDIDMRLDIEEVFLGMDTAVPLGIIVNELVSNSLKHAFPSGRKGKIHIKLSREEKSTRNKSISNITNNIGAKSSVENNIHYTLVVSDDGLGFPENIDFRSTNSLGLQLVNILVEQLDGSIELKSNSGTKFKIWFKDTYQLSEDLSSIKGEIE